MASRQGRRPAGVGAGAVWSKARKRWEEGEFWFDEAAADKAAGFFPTHLRFTKGEWADKPFKLERWEEYDVVRPLFGWKRADGTRRYRRCFVWLPRKNGKTELAAGIALLVLIGDAEEGGEVYAIAANKDQANIVFDRATAMVAKSPILINYLTLFKTSVYCGELNAAFKPLSGKAEGKHGFNVSGLIGDEIHEWTDGNLYQFMHDSEDARSQPLEFLISTAGKNGTYGAQVWDECVKIRDGVIEDPSTLVVIYAADREDDWLDEATWRKANPSLGVAKKIETMRENARRARQLPRLENHFRNYHLNQWTDQAVRWLPMDAEDDNGRLYGWDHCVGDIGWRELEEKLLGKRCFGAIDLSATTDLSALVWWFPVQDGLDVPAVLPRFFKPAAQIQAHVRRDKLPYDEWVDEGALMATPGNVVDYAFIQEQVYSDAARFQLAHAGDHKREKGQGGLALDPWNAIETAVKLQQEGLPVVLFRYGAWSMNAPSKELERLVIDNALHHGAHPVLRQHVRAVAVETDAQGNIKPSKAASSERIDGVVAHVMAIGLALRSVDADEGTVIPDDYRMSA